MANGYTFYQPNEYEQCMIFAGWITIESCDDQYQAYLKRIGKFGEVMDYAEWCAMCEEWNRLDLAFDAIPDEASGAYPREKVKLLDQMCWIEGALGL